jgi:2-oxo-hept-3-ene-1,7-dioate hydratase
MQQPRRSRARLRHAAGRHVLRDGSDIPRRPLHRAAVEVELAFVLASRWKARSVTLFDVLNATDYVVPAIEIIDARIEQFDRDTKAPRKVFDTISDNAANAGIVLGGRPMRPDAVDLRWVGALLYKNGVIEESGWPPRCSTTRATAWPGWPTSCAVHGVSLAAGEIVLAGSFTRPVACAAGDTFHADYGHWVPSAAAALFEGS